MLTRSIVALAANRRRSEPFFAMDVPAFAAAGMRGFRYLIQYINANLRTIAAALLSIRRRFDRRRTSAWSISHHPSAKSQRPTGGHEAARNIQSHVC
jgi:hypothetical protein